MYCSDMTEGYQKVLEGLQHQYDINFSEEDLFETSVRASHMILGLCSGYTEDPAEILKVTWKTECNSLVLQKHIEFTSLCAHHLAIIRGEAHVGYIPRDGRVVGLSKLVRLVDCFSHRLQLQEQMTDQIADALVEHLEPVGAMVVVEAHHDCMRVRGVRRDTETVTSAVRGVFRDEPEARAEFLSLCRA